MASFHCPRWTITPSTATYSRRGRASTTPSAGTDHVAMARADRTSASDAARPEVDGPGRWPVSACSSAAAGANGSTAAANAAALASPTLTSAPSYGNPRPRTRRTPGGP